MGNRSIWGDGFAEDDWCELLRIREGSFVGEDEFVRLFPSLVPAGGYVGGQVREIVVARASAIMEMAGSTPEYSKGFRWNERLSRLCASRPVTTSFGAGDDADFLRSLVSEDPSPVQLDANEPDMARFAYLTGVHPAYLWPAAATLAYWGTAVAWLGSLARCGAAMVPIEVADYFSETLVADVDRSVRHCDPLIAEYVSKNVDTCKLLRAVERRRDGATAIVVRRKPAWPQTNRVPYPPKRWLERLWVVFRPAATFGSRAQ
jgi:hypothetical protein